MRNLLSIFALIISLAGMGISLTREEIRCWVGLPSNSCQSSRFVEPSLLEPKSPSNPRQETGGVEETRESPATDAPKAVEENSEPTEAAAPDSNAANTTSQQVSEIAPSVGQEAAPPASQPQEASQPIEVVPPPAESSQPIEVIPPPATSNP